MFGFSFNFTGPNLIASIVAGVAAFGAAYNAAAVNATPGVQGGEWAGVIGAGLIALLGTLTRHDVK